MLIGFLGTAWLAVLLVVVRYVLVFDPHVDPLHNAKSGKGTGWKPNPIDVRMIKVFKKLRARLGDDRRWEASVTKVCSTEIHLHPWYRLKSDLGPQTTSAI